MSKYVVKPDDPKNFVTVDIYVKNNPNGSFHVLTFDEEASLDFNNLPKEITKESSTWLRKKSFCITNLMEDESWEEIPSKKLGEPIQVRRNYSKLQLAKIKYLLKDWTLKNDSPELVLKFVVVPGTNVSVIEPSQLQLIDTCLDESIIGMFISKYILASLKSEDSLKN